MGWAALLARLDPVHGECHLVSEWSGVARMPVPPCARVETLPTAVSDLVMKLLLKTPEVRYQIEAGIERDLHHCLVEWQRQYRIDEFPPGQI